MDPSPAEKYAAFRRRQIHPDVAAFASRQGFPLDPFQYDACEAVANGRSVLVAAPTGAGKTLVGEFAVEEAVRRGEKAFYTTPIKALSNQKFNDLREVHGAQRVGLLTGDTSINGDADIVVMTTEVLRNMLYAGSRTLDRLGVVVLDEVHYLADRFRGSVWEEVIVHLDLRTAIVALSATVSNAEEFGAWLQEVRGDTEVIVSERRPVPLWPHVLMREGMFDLYAPEVDPSDLGLTPRINPELEAITKRQRHEGGRQHPDRMNFRPSRGNSRPTGRRSPPRFAVVDVLDREGLLPAIVFVFSRAGCDDAVDQVKSAGVNLTTEEERSRIAAVIDERCAGLPAEDLGALGFQHWRHHLEAGIAAHHAGMIPLFKEVVENLFTAGLIKVVFATETLALGINMPARCVVLEKLVKWDGQGHKDLTAGEYTQLTGRAGRRGIDIEGHAVVVEHPGFDVNQLARLASRRTYPLTSSFHPSYNMAVNLVANSGVVRARQVLELSFAQYQADQSVVGQARRVKELDTALDGYRIAAKCHLGDFMEYAALREQISVAEKAASQHASSARREATEEQLSALVPGDVVKVGAGRRSGLSVVVQSDHGPAPRPGVVSDQGRLFRLSLAELHHGLEVVGKLRIPKRFDASNARQRRELAGVLEASRNEFQKPSKRRPATEQPAMASVEHLRAALKAHPCHACPEREAHARWSERYFRTKRDKDRIANQIHQATGSIARIFDRRCDVLSDLGYMEGMRDQREVTDAGHMLTTLYAENDIVIAECLRAGVWEHLSAPALAAVVSSVIYQGRRDDDAATPRIPGGQTGALGIALRETARVWSHLADIHKEHQLPELPRPQWGMVGPIHGWAQGKGLNAALAGTETAPGDMVRWCKQVIDALDQIADVAPHESIRARARSAIEAMRRGVVAY